MIRFNKPSITGLEEKYLQDALHNGILSGDGKYTFRVYEHFKNRFDINHMLLTTSGTTAIEMAAILINLQQGDEVILPSFTFSSTANALMLRGAKPVFCDIREDTFNINENLIEALITEKTKAIFTVDYAGVPCEMDVINAIAKKYNLYVVADSAQAVGSYYNELPSGKYADFTCFSFHETKNYIMGEGGGLVIENEEYIDRAEIIREKGTNRRQVLNGLVDKYTWHDIGSSFLPSDLLAAILCAQMERFEEIMEKRMNVWNTYYELLESLENKGFLRRAIIPGNVRHNAHMFNIILQDSATRSKLIDHLRKNDIMAYICYVPLHSSPMGLKLGYTPEMLPVTEDLGARILRLPLYADMTKEDAMLVVQEILKFGDLHV